MFFRANVLLRKFSKCSVTVKTVLFKAFCVCLYDVALWTSYSVTIFNKFQSCYNKCMKIFFGYRRSYSVTLMLGEIGLPSFNTIIFNSCASFTYIWSTCSNNVINYMNSIRCGYWDNNLRTFLVLCTYMYALVYTFFLFSVKFSVMVFYVFFFLLYGPCAWNTTDWLIDWILHNSLFNAGDLAKQSSKRSLT